MSIVLERFGTVELPLIEATQDIGAIGTRTSYSDLPGGGVHDGYGSGRAPRGLYSLVARGETLVDSFGDLVVPMDTLRALRGRHDKLYARMDDQSVRWVWARCRDVPITRTVDNVLYLASDLRFDVKSPVWNGTSHGGGWLWDSGVGWDTGAAWDEAAGDVFTLDSAGPSDHEIINAGNAVVRNPILKFSAPDALIDGFTLLSAWEGEDQISTILQSDIIYTGIIGEDQTLVLDCGAQSATISTSMSTGAPAAEDELDVFNSAGFTTGNPISVQLETGGWHDTTIAATADVLHVTLVDPLPSDAIIGALVVMSAYPDLSFGPTHRLGSAWFILESGTTFVTVEIDSTDDATLTISFNDGWE